MTTLHIYRECYCLGNMHSQARQYCKLLKLGVIVRAVIQLVSTHTSNHLELVEHLISWIYPVWFEV